MSKVVTCHVIPSLEVYTMMLKKSSVFFSKSRFSYTTGIGFPTFRKAVALIQRLQSLLIKLTKYEKNGLAFEFKNRILMEELNVNGPASK